MKEAKTRMGGNTSRVSRNVSLLFLLMSVSVLVPNQQDVCQQDVCS